MTKMTTHRKSAPLGGRDYWRSLDELAESAEFKEFLLREFPAGTVELGSGLSRRNFLKMMGASFALAGLAACRRPAEKIVPYVKQPEEIIPGIANYYATAMPMGLTAYGLLVKSNEGRPTKIEGNPQHPSTAGASSALLQAQILGLYDPDRARQPKQLRAFPASGRTVAAGGMESNWSSFVEAWRQLYTDFARSGGQGLAILAESFHAPTLARLQSQWQQRFPKATWVSFDPVSDENSHRGIEMVHGAPLLPQHHFDKADIVLSLDADFLLGERDAIVAARGFAKRRRVSNERDDMSRLYVVESLLTLTGAMADHRQVLQSRQIPAFTAALLLELKRQGVALSSELVASLQKYAVHPFNSRWLQVVAKELRRHRGRSLIVVGRRQPPLLHALGALMNQALGNVGQTVSYSSLNDAAPSDHKGLLALAEQMGRGQIDTLVIFGGNPLYNLPAGMDFASLIKKVGHTIHFSPYRDETSRVVHWHLPQSHFLESWEDVRSGDGCYSVVQPLIEPLFDSRSRVEFLHLLATGKQRSGYEIIKESFAKMQRRSDGEAVFNKRWRRLLHDGFGTVKKPATTLPKFRYATVARQLQKTPFPQDIASSDKLEVVFYASAKLFDGRFANNGWLQELPDAVTKLTWDNAALISPKTAAALRVKNHDVVSLNYKGRELKLPVWIVPGCADNSVALELGYGRSQCGRVGDGVGVNAYRLRDVQTPDYGVGLTLKKTGATYKLASTQDHGSMQGRPLIREATLADYRENPNFAAKLVEHPPLKSLWKEPSYTEGYQWGMAIDLNSCIGCNACTIACQSENNIPIVGKEQVAVGREMHWIRVDRYFSGDLHEPSVAHQPVPCQHCENAPCEQVCPVAATVHDKEGLNVMAYNRCIGTRYCANNCPYKVRRFNYFNYTNRYDDVEKLAQNPDVTVRFRGVMEKCTFCTQRIEGAKATAKREGRSVRDGEIQTACQQSCPTDAISFGNINDPDSRVAQLKQQNRNYEMLGELNVKPRNSYLAKLRNPNPELES